MEGLLVSYVSDEESDSEQNPISSLLPKYVAADDDEEEDNKEKQEKTQQPSPVPPPVVVPDPPVPSSTISTAKPETSAEPAPVVKTKKKKASKWAAISASIKKEAKEKAVQVSFSSSSSAPSDPLQGPQGPPRGPSERDDQFYEDEEMLFEEEDEEDQEEDEDWGGYFETPGSLELQSLGKELLQTPLPLPNYLSDLIPLGECSTEVKQKLHGLFEAKRRGRSINENISLQPSFKHPKIVGRLAMVRGIHEKLSAFPPEIYNPNRFHPSEYFPELDKEVLHYEEQKKIEQQKRTRIEFTREREPVSVGGQPTLQFNQQPAAAPPVFQDNYARFFAASRVSAASADLDEPSSSSSSNSKKRLRSPPTSPPPVRSSKWDARPRK